MSCCMVVSDNFLRLKLLQVYRVLSDNDVSVAGQSSRSILGASRCLWVSSWHWTMAWSIGALQTMSMSR